MTAATRKLDPAGERLSVTIGGSVAAILLVLAARVWPETVTADLAAPLGALATALSGVLGRYLRDRRSRRTQGA